MNDTYQLSNRTIQSIGLACIPRPGMTASAPIATKPVAAAILTIQQRDDGHVDVVGTAVADVRPTEFPLPWLTEQALLPGALTTVTPSDRVALACECAARRYFLEPRLASIIQGNDVEHPLGAMGAKSEVIDDIEELAYVALDIPTVSVSDNQIERLWSRKAPQAALDIAMARAVSRLILWASSVSMGTGDPGTFFEILLALRPWIDAHGDDFPSLRTWGTSRPIMRAVSHEQKWRAHQQRRNEGDVDSRWTEFRDGLFHT